MTEDYAHNTEELSAKTMNAEENTKGLTAPHQQGAAVRQEEGTVEIPVKLEQGLTSDHDSHSKLPLMDLNLMHHPDCRR